MFVPTFEEDLEIETRVDQESPKPDFHKLFLSHYNKQELNDLWYFLEDSEFGGHIFLKGLFYEYGVYPLATENKKIAFETYQHGAEQKDSYCNFRLHFIYKKEFEEFGVRKDRNLEMIYLIKAAAFFDEKDNRINRKYLDPVLHLAVHLDHEDPDLIKSVELLESFKQESETNKKIGDFLHYWCCVRFSLSDHIKDECLKNITALAEENDAEACYFLGEAHRSGDEFQQDLSLSKKYLEAAKENGCVKAFESLGYLYQLNKQSDLSIQNYKEGSKKGLYTSLKIYGEYQIVGKYTNQDFEQGLKNIYYAYLQCDFWALLTMYEIFKYFELKEKKKLEITTKMFHLAKTLFEIKGKIGKIAHIRLAYSVYSECYEKGYGVQQDLDKAKSVLLESLQKIELEKLKTLNYYRLAVISEKKKDFDEANKYYDYCIRACLMMVEGYNIIKNQAYFYLVGKLLYFGKGTIKNISKAREYLQEGVKMENSFYFGAIYSKKCQNLLRKLPNKDLPLKIYESKGQERNKMTTKTVKTALISSLKDITFDVYLGTVSSVKMFYGKLKNQPVRLEEYCYTSEKNYLRILNHLINIMNLKSSSLDKIIGIGVDPKSNMLVSIFRPIDLKFIQLCKIFENEIHSEINVKSSTPNPKASIKKSKENDSSQDNNQCEKGISKYSFSQKVEVSLKIANGIQDLHDSKTSHGNLNPETIYISSNRDVLLISYGLQNHKFYDNDTAYFKGENESNLSRKYLPPESLQQKSRCVNLSSDLWSLGMIMYLIFCEKPFSSSLSVSDALQAQKKHLFDWSFSSDLPKGIQDIIKQCVQLNPKDRGEISSVIHTLKSFC